MTSKPALYALLAGLLLTSGIVVLDAAYPDSSLTTSLRTAGATATGPVLTTISETFPQPAASDEELTRVSAQLALAQDDLRTAQGSAELAGADHVAAADRIILARVVALGAIGPAGPERLTLDVGTDDGVAEDQSVVAAYGLVGRTVRVGATTSDVLIIGAPDLVVSARGAESGLLGTVMPGATGDREPGQLTFTPISFGEPTPGEPLLTLGSPDNRPFVAGLPVGSVTSVDPAAGRISRTAAVAPSVDIARLNVVAVIVPEGAADGD